MEKNVKYIKCSTAKMFLTIFGSIILSVICGFFGFFDFRKFVEGRFTNDAIYYAVKVLMAIISILFVLFLIFLIIIYVTNKNKFIEIGDDYFIDRSSLMSSGKIYYSEIDYLYFKGMFLCVKLKNDEEFLKRQNRFKKFAASIDKKMKYDYITISDVLLSTNLVEVKRLIDEKRKEYEALNSDLGTK